MNKHILLDEKEQELLLACLTNQAPGFTAGEKAMAERIEKRFKRSQTRIAVSSAKSKGREFQKAIATKISELIKMPYDQADDDCLIHSREMGQHGVDIVLRGKAGKLFPFSVECKNSEQLSLPEFIRQASANSTAERPWLLAIKNKRIPDPIVVLDWETFEAIFLESLRKFL